jgi:hypothetical protein
MLFRDEEFDARQIFASFDAPAFVRRARDVHGNWEEILGRCRRQREEWLKLPKVRLGRLFALAGDWPAVGRLLAEPAEVERLEELYRARGQVRDSPPPPQRSPRAGREPVSPRSRGD